MKTATKKSWTERKLMSLPKIGHKYELIDGGLVMVPAGFEHEIIGVRLIVALGKFVSDNKLGVVCGPDLGYWMKSGNLRCPDVSFINKKRLQKFKKLPRGFLQGSPDLAVEILSPSDTIETIHGKITEYFENNTKLAWVINPEDRTVLIYHSPNPDKILTDKDTLNGEEILKGFSFPIAELFAKLV